MEHVEIGAVSGGMRISQDRITTPGGYKGAEMICAMGPWPTMGQWKDNAVRFDGALMAVPYVDYFEHSQDMTFLKDTAYPFLKAQAEFYSSYIVLNKNGRYDVPLACAQEACGPRQLEHVINAFTQYNPTVDLACACAALSWFANVLPHSRVCVI
eukprot:SAG31_NODE_1227_length_9239_cov_29.041904_7_plen_155_part_00